MKLITHHALSVGPQMVELKPESLVSPIASLLGVILADGRHVPVEMLGPGVVKRVDSDGMVLVHWVRPDADALIDPDDLQSLGSDAHLITIIRLNDWSAKPISRHKVITSPGLLEHNWRIELLPKNIVRTIRPDGSAWTFDWNPTLGSVNTRNTVDFPPPGPDDAEALYNE